nr:hypothetical protein [Tanacetum cinerariifolium]
PQNLAFQTKYLDAYDSDCDDLSSAKAVLMANILSCDSDVLYEESQDAVIQDTNSSAPNDLLVLSLVKQMTNHVAYLDKENQTTKMSKRPRNDAWFKGKLMLSEAQEAGQILDEEQLAFLVDPEISEAPIAQ